LAPVPVTAKSYGSFGSGSGSATLIQMKIGNFRSGFFPNMYVMKCFAYLRAKGFKISSLETL